MDYKFKNPEYRKKVEKISCFDCRKENQLEKLNDIFSKIVIKKYGIKNPEITVDEMFEIIRREDSENKIHVSYIFNSPSGGLSATLLDCNSATYDMICVVYGETFSEIFKKVIAAEYFVIKDRQKS